MPTTLAPWYMLLALTIPMGTTARGLPEATRLDAPMGSDDPLPAITLWTQEVLAGFKPGRSV